MNPTMKWKNQSFSSLCDCSVFHAVITIIQAVNILSWKYSSDFWCSFTCKHKCRIIILNRFTLTLNHHKLIICHCSCLQLQLGFEYWIHFPLVMYTVVLLVQIPLGTKYLERNQHCVLLKLCYPGPYFTYLLSQLIWIFQALWEQLVHPVVVLIGNLNSICAVLCCITFSLESYFLQC